MVLNLLIYPGENFEKVNEWSIFKTSFFSPLSSVLGRDAVQQFNRYMDPILIFLTVERTDVYQIKSTLVSEYISDFFEVLYCLSEMNISWFIPSVSWFLPFIWRCLLTFHIDILNSLHSDSDYMTGLLFLFINMIKWTLTLVKIKRYISHRTARQDMLEVVVNMFVCF